MRKIIALLLCAILALSLFAACDKKDTNVPGATDPTGPSGEGGITETKKAGSIVVTANASVRINFGEDGLVVSLEGINDYGKDLLEAYEEKLGESTANMVGQIIRDSSAHSNMGRLNYVVVKHEKDSAAPGTNFLEAIETAAKSAVAEVASNPKLVIVTQDMLDADGYINLVTAKVLVEAFLEVESVDNFDGTPKPVNGMYAFKVTYDGMEEDLHMDAVTGGVGQGEINDVIPEETEPEETEPEGTEPPESAPEETLPEATVEATAAATEAED